MSKKSNTDYAVKWLTGCYGGVCFSNEINFTTNSKATKFEASKISKTSKQPAIGTWVSIESDDDDNGVTKNVDPLSYFIFGKKPIIQDNELIARRNNGSLSLHSS